MVRARLVRCPPHQGRRDPLGDHFSATAALRSMAGWDLIAQVVTGDTGRGAKVALRIPADKESPGGEGRQDALRIGERIILEPEEARMLARLRVTAVDETERAQDGRLGQF